jgi:hypothetical protein
MERSDKTFDEEEVFLDETQFIRKATGKDGFS